MAQLRVLMDPAQRIEYLKRVLEQEGLNVEEDPKAAYCPISLTSTPESLKEFLKGRQKTLMEAVLSPAGIKAYDPASSPYSPDLDTSQHPSIIYRVDSSRVAAARFFVGHNILPSTGFGTEMEIAKTLNRIAVVFMDKNIRVSRMQTPRTIYLEYGNFEEDSGKFIPVFQMLQGYEPGIGLVENGSESVPVLLGFENMTGKVVNLEEEVYKEFPVLKYSYNGNMPIAKLGALNPELFYESRRPK